MTKPITINFGKRSYEVKFARWDSERHVGLIQVYDDIGNAFIVKSDGLAPHEQRRAIASFAQGRASLAPAFGYINHPATCPCVNCT